MVSVSGGFNSFDYDPQFGGEETWGKAESFCLDCQSAVTNTDWPWRLNYPLKPIVQKKKQPLRFDGETPAEIGAEFCNDVRTLKSRIPSACSIVIPGRPLWV